MDMEQKQLMVGIGLYTVPEAARLSGVPAQRIRRWLMGYRTRLGEAGRAMPPVWRGQLPPINDVLGLGFMDLMELRFVEAFRKHGVSLPIIRRTAERAQELFQRDHPFARLRFKSDGRGIFAEIIEETGKRQLLDLVRNQYAFHQVISPSLYEGLDFSNQDDVLRWYPMHPRKAIVVDPERAFGRPIVAAGGVPTDILARAVVTEGSDRFVARWYDVPLKAVRAAVAFEEKLAA